MAHLVEVKKRLFGGHSLSYSCPRCQEGLSSPLDDAGKVDTCPECGVGFTVPGVEEKERLRSAEESAKQLHDQQRYLAELQRKESGRQRTIQRTPAENVLAAGMSATPIDTGRLQLGATATRLCPYCAEEINAAAKKCKHCREYLTRDTGRREAPNSSAKPWYKPSKAASCLIIFFVVCIVINQLSPQIDRGRDANAGVSSAGEQQMIKAAQRGVLRVLKAPSTADFPSPAFSRHEYSITQISSDTFRVRGYVDAQNSFGAKLRREFEATCTGSGMDWYAASVTLLGE